MSEIPTLLSTEQVAEKLGVPKTTLYATRYRRTPPGSLAIRVGRALKWVPGDLEAWLESLREERRTDDDGRSSK